MYRVRERYADIYGSVYCVNIHQLSDDAMVLCVSEWNFNGLQREEVYNLFTHRCKVPPVSLSLGGPKTKQL